ncbi:MAG: gamma-glutamylcyclotransferase family protein [Novosphingobium sp.]
MATEPPLRFFFYGTLIGGGPPAVRQALGKLRDLGPARAAGAVHAIPDPGGWYPALVAGEGTVAGRLYEATPDFGEADLAALDAYEEFDPADPAGSPYLRVPIAEGLQAYRFNRPLPPDARPIPDGDFAAWIGREGLRAFHSP